MVAIEVLCALFICGLIVIVVAAELSAININKDHTLKLEKGLPEAAVIEEKSEGCNDDDVNALSDKGSECLSSET